MKGREREREREVLTVRVQSEVLQTFLHLLTLVLPHEAIVNVHSDDLLWPKGGQEQRRAHCAVHTATDQGLQAGGRREEGGGRSVAIR